MGVQSDSSTRYTVQPGRPCCVGAEFDDSSLVPMPYQSVAGNATRPAHWSDDMEAGVGDLVKWHLNVPTLSSGWW